MIASHPTSPESQIFYATPARATVPAPRYAISRGGVAFLGGLLVLLVVMFAAPAQSDAATRGPAPAGCLRLDTSVIRTVGARARCRTNERKVSLYNCVNKLTKVIRPLNSAATCARNEVPRARYACRDRLGHETPVFAGDICPRGQTLVRRSNNFTSAS